MQRELVSEGFPPPRGNTGIYILLSSSCKFYVGQSTNLAKRFYEHSRLLRNGTHANNHLQRSFDKYGQLSFMVVEYLDDPTLLTEREQYWMDKFNAYDKGMNQTPAADSSLGCTRTPEQRKVISEITKEYWGKDENREAQSLRKKAFHVNNPEHSLLMSKITKDRLASRPELVERHAEFMIELSNTPEAIATFTERMDKWRKTQTKAAMSERARKSVATKATKGEAYKKRCKLRARITKNTSKVGPDSVDWQRSKTRSGTPRDDAVARWMEVDGKQKMKKFSVAKYGVMKAHYLACQFWHSVRDRLTKELDLALSNL